MTWWWDEEVQESIRKKRLEKKRWGMKRVNKSIRCDETRRKRWRWPRTRQGEVYEGFYTKEGENTLYRLARQRHQSGKDVQQVRMMKMER